jgi:transcriptional regulator with XRE-family HTH domain
MPTSGRQPEDDQPDASESRDVPGAADHPEFPDVGAFIRTQRERAKLSVRRLAELAEVSNPYLSQIERGLRKPSAEVLQQVAHALRISVESLYVRAGILASEARSVSTVPEAIEADPSLTPEQKQALRNVYDSFVNR